MRSKQTQLLVCRVSLSAPQIQGLRRCMFGLKLHARTLVAREFPNSPQRRARWSMPARLAEPSIARASPQLDRFASRRSATTLAFLRRFTSPSGHRWQRRHLWPLEHPCGFQNQAHGSHWPMLCSAEPSDGSPAGASSSHGGGGTSPGPGAASGAAGGRGCGGSPACNRPAVAPGSSGRGAAGPGAQLPSPRSSPRGWLCG